MVNMGFELTEFPKYNPLYSFRNIYFIPKRGIHKVTRAQLMLGMYNAGVKNSYILGQNSKITNYDSIKIRGTGR